MSGHVTDHDRLLLAKMLARIDALDADIAELDTVIKEMVAPFVLAVERLDEVPGVGTTAAQVVIAAVGVDMSRFPTAAHLASWVRFAPEAKESAGRAKGRGTTGHGNRYLARVLGEAAMAAGKTDTFLGERYRRIARRRGKKKESHRCGRAPSCSGLRGADRRVGGAAGPWFHEFLAAAAGGFDRGQDQAAGGSLVAGAFDAAQARWAAGSQGSGLATAPDWTETVPAPSDCSGCGEGLGEAEDAGLGSRAGVGHPAGAPSEGALPAAVGRPQQCTSNAG